MVIITGWKNVAATLGVSVRTAQRMRLAAGLPVANLSPRLVAARRPDLEAWWSAVGATWRDAGVARGAPHGPESGAWSAPSSTTHEAA